MLADLRIGAHEAFVRTALAAGAKPEAFSEDREAVLRDFSQVLSGLAAGVAAAGVAVATDAP